MSFAINIKSNIDKISRDMDSLEKRQLPFAMSLTLNKIALSSQEQICKAIPRIFNNSNKWWDRHQRTGIKVSFATKYGLTSSVYTKAHFAHIQEEGGIKKPYSSTNLAIPTSNIPKRQRRSNALKDNQSNKSIFKRGKSIYRRISNQKLQRLYSLSPYAKVRPRFGFKQMAINTFNKQFDKLFTENFNHAMRTAK